MRGLLQLERPSFQETEQRVSNWHLMQDLLAIWNVKCSRSEWLRTKRSTNINIEQKHARNTCRNCRTSHWHLWYHEFELFGIESSCRNDLQLDSSSGRNDSVWTRHINNFGEYCTYVCFGKSFCECIECLCDEHQQNCGIKHSNCNSRNNFRNSYWSLCKHCNDILCDCIGWRNKLFVDRSIGLGDSKWTRNKFNFSFAAGTAGGSITVRGVNACGNSSTRSLTVTVVNCARMAMDEGTEGEAQLIILN
jgi:hypothetical protein